MNANEPQKRDWLPDVFLILGALLIVYSRFIFTDQMFRSLFILSDWIQLTHPSLVYTGESLLKGELPLWNPYWFSGFPHLAIPSTSVFYPTTILYGLLDWPVSVKVVALLHVYILAVNGYFLAREYSFPRVIRLLISFNLITGALALGDLQIGHIWRLQTFAWMPLLFIFLRRILHEGRSVWALWFTVFFALTYLGGDPQNFGYILYWMGAYTVFELGYRGFVLKESWQLLGRKAALCLSAIAVGILLVGIQLLPSQEFLHESIRQNGVSLSYLKFLSPRASDLWGRFLAHGEASFLAGTIMAALILVGMRDVNRREVYALCFASVASFLYVFMPDWFYYGFIKYVPVYNTMRGSIRMSAAVVVPAYLLMGFGLSRLIQSESDPNASAQAWRQLALLATVAAAVPLFYRWNVLPWMWISAAVVLSAAFIALKFSQWRGAAFAILLILCGVETWRFHGERLFARSPHPYEVHPLYADFSANRNHMDRVAIFHPQLSPIRHRGGIGLLTKDRVFNGYHALWLANYARLMRDVAGAGVWEVDEENRLTREGDFKKDWITPSSIRILDLFNVRDIVTYNLPIAIFEQDMASGGRRFSVSQENAFRVYTNHGAMGPAHVFHEAVVCETNEEAIELLAEPDFPYKRVAILTEPFDPAILAPAQGPEAITILKYEPHEIVLSVDMTAPGLLMVSEMDYPGWMVSVDDGPEINVLRINTALRGVQLDPGLHTVQFVFRSPSFAQGKTVSLAGGTIFAVWCVAVWAGRRRKHPEKPNAQI